MELASDSMIRDYKLKCYRKPPSFKIAWKKWIWKIIYRNYLARKIKELIYLGGFKIIPYFGNWLLKNYIWYKKIFYTYLLLLS